MYGVHPAIVGVMLVPAPGQVVATELGFKPIRFCKDLFVGLI